MGTIDVTAIILAIISFLSGLGWMLDRKKHRQEVEALRADVKQKELDLSKDYVTEWRTYIAEPLTIVDLCRDSAKLMRAWLCARCSRLTLSTSVATRQCLKASFRHCARCSIGCSGRWGSSGRKWRNCVMPYKLLTSFSSDATRPSPSKLGWRSLLPRLTCVLIGLSALCWTSCASSRKATSSLQLTAYGLQETRDTVREQVMVAVHDTIREVTTITVQTNDAGD